jgi:hypothetical protein
MTQRVFHSPQSGSAAAATTPERLARELDGNVRWRELPNGELEVATINEGRVDRYHVQPDGERVLVDASAAPFGHRSGRRLAIIGLLLIFASIAVSASTSETAGFVIFLLGLGLGFAGLIARSRSDDLDARLKKIDKGGEWHEPTNLHGWVPRSAEQLAAVERIADDHDGLAFVRDIGTRTIEVLAMRRGRLERYWVDEVGTSGVEVTASLARRYVADRLLHGLSLLIWLGILGVLFAVQHNKGLLLAVLIGCLAAVLLAGSLNDRQLALERHVKRLEAADGQTWIEIRTRVEENDGG